MNEENLQQSTRQTICPIIVQASPGLTKSILSLGHVVEEACYSMRRVDTSFF